MIQIVGNELIARLPYAFYQKCVSIVGGTWENNTKCWRYPITPTTARSFLTTFPSSLFKPEEITMFKNMEQGLVNAALIRNYPEPPAYSITKGGTPWKHQRTAYWMASEVLGLHTHGRGGGFGIFHDMGTGKSKTMIDIMQNNLEATGGVYLITAPLAVVKNTWEKELHKWWADVENIRYCTLFKGSVEDKTRTAWEMLKVARALRQPAVIVINYDSVWREPFATFLLEDAHVGMMANDEVHRLKSPNGKTSNFFSRLARKVPFNLGLTGTPMGHSPQDPYGYYRTLDPGIFGVSFGKYKAEYAIEQPMHLKDRVKKNGEVAKGRRQNRIVGYKNLDRLSEKMFSIAHRVKLREVQPDLPPWTHEVRSSEFLTPAEAKAYNEMDADLMTEIQGNTITAANVLVKALRLREMTGGYVEGIQYGMTKKKLLEDTLLDIPMDEPLVVVAWFTNELKDIREVVEHSGRTYSELSGKRKDEERWLAGETDVLGVQIASGREGVDFTRCCYNILYDTGCSLIQYQQFVRRSDRPGQTRSGVFIHLNIEGTVDFKIMRALERGENVAEAIMEMYKKEG